MIIVLLFVAVVQSTLLENVLRKEVAVLGQFVIVDIELDIIWHND